VDVPRQDAALLESMRQRLDAVLLPLLAPGEPCALLGYPDHNNVGDNAIWLGTVGWLQARGFPITYTCDPGSYGRDELHRRLPARGTILLCGGGDLGDLWPARQQFRQQVIEDFPGRRIVLLPQSIHFTFDANLREAAAVFDRHRHLTVLLRDGASLERARDAFGGVRTELCPDMAVALGPLARPPDPEVDIVWLGRTDREATSGRAPPVATDVGVCEWASTAPGRPALRLARRLAHPLQAAPRGSLRRLPGLSSLGHRLYALSTDGAASIHLGRGRRILGKGRVVVTERLHGHVLSLLLGIDHVLIDNSYGKLGSYYTSWSAGSDLAQMAESPDDALRRARRLLEDARRRSREPG